MWLRSASKPPNIKFLYPFLLIKYDFRMYKNTLSEKKILFRNFETVKLVISP